MMKTEKFASLALAAVLAATALAGCGNPSGSDKPGVGYPDAEGYAEGALGDTMHTEFFDFTVNDAYTCASYEGYIPREGNQIAVVELTIQNTFSESIPMFDVDFQIQWDDDADDARMYPVTLYLESGETAGPNMFPDKYELAEKERRTGILAYEVPAGKTEFSISYLTKFDDQSQGSLFFVYFTAKTE